MSQKLFKLLFLNVLVSFSTSAFAWVDVVTHVKNVITWEGSENIVFETVAGKSCWFNGAHDWALYSSVQTALSVGHKIQITCHDQVDRIITHDAHKLHRIIVKR